MTFSRTRTLTFFAVFALLVAAACGGDEQDTGAGIQRITCAETADCIARGGFCADRACRADNECATNADCGDGVCVADRNFGGLCGDPEAGPPAPGPAWSCASGADCPVGQGCADGVCKADGECTASADCGDGRICYSGNDDPAGICASGRPATNPYCRSDGTGACRYECNGDGTCAASGATCSGGFCHFSTECVSNDDCSPNHVCVPTDAGYSWCVPDENPTCVPAPDGVCRLACEGDRDCLVGGGCAADHFCHASNECRTADDCAPGEICYEREWFGGLCGPERRP